jgi:type I restriction enzyme S subunit
MSELPDGWELISLGTLIELNPKTNDVEGCTEVGFVPMTLLGKSWLDVPGFELRQWASVKKGYTHFRDGDVLLAKITPCFENGKAGLLKGLPNGIGSGSTEYFVCRTSPNTLDARYLLGYLKTDDFVRTGAMSMTGSVGHKRVPKEYLLGRRIPLPPRSEQTRIANQLNTLLARVQACNDRFDAIPALLKRFRQTVLDAALNGAFLEGAAVAESELPKVSISTIASVGTGSTPLRSNSQFFASSGTPWITSSATSAAVITGANEFVTPAAISAHRLKLFPKGTLLVAMYGEGKTRGQVAELGIVATINQACAAVVVNESKAVRAYVKLALQANYLNMRELAEGGNQPNLNLSKVKEFEIPLPSLAEQTEIVRRVEALFALADHIEARCTAARTQAQRLTPLVLAKAFRGELVPQDPNDEPASALLARIASSNIAVVEKNKRKVPVARKERALTAINL